MRWNLNEAYKRVNKNKGSYGIDKMGVDELLTYLRENWTRAKKMPNLDKVLKSDKKKSMVMSDEDMLKQVKILNSIFGGEVISKGVKIDGTEE